MREELRAGKSPAAAIHEGYDKALSAIVDATVQQAVELYELVDQENVLIKIPATVEGLPAIRRTIANGISVNVTLIFSLERYREVMAAYLAGLEDAAAAATVRALSP